MLDNQRFCIRNLMKVFWEIFTPKKNVQKTKNFQGERTDTSTAFQTLLTTGACFLTEISVRSPRKMYISIITPNRNVTLIVFMSDYDGISDRAFKMNKMSFQII